LLFLAVGRLVDGFHVSGFGAAFWGSIIVSVTNIVVSALIKKSNPPPPPSPPPGAGPRRREQAGDVIDI
jgi:putative membrane protein